MAIGVTPKFSQQILVPGYNTRECRSLAALVAQERKWRIVHVAAKGLIIIAPTGSDSNSEMRIIAGEGAMHVESASTGSEMADMGRNKQKVLEFQETLYAIVAGSPDQAMLRQLEQELDEVTASPENDRLNPASAVSKLERQWWRIFIPGKTLFVTPLLIDLNILLFIIMLIGGAGFMGPDAETMAGWGGNIRGLTVEGGWWRLITNIFLHFGALHLLMNMIGLLSVGVYLEPLLGKTAFACVYLATGILASLASIAWSANTVSAGASGAIFGLYGVFLALLTTNLVTKEERSSLLGGTAIFVGYSLLNGLRGGIDNAAHIGGLISGVLFGYLLYFFALREEAVAARKSGMAAILLTITALLSFWVLTKLKDPLTEYARIEEDIIKMETSANDNYNTSLTVTDRNKKLALLQAAMRNLEQCAQKVATLPVEGLPKEVASRKKILVAYYAQKQIAFGTAQKAVSENTNRYDALIESAFKKCDSLLELDK